MTVYALLVLDLFDDLVGPDGLSAGSGYPEQAAERNVLDRVCKAIDTAHTAGDLVVWVTVGFEPGYVDLPARSPLFGGVRASGGFRRGTPGTRPLAGLPRNEADPVIVKPRVSPFFGTRLDSLLRTAGVTEVVLTGVATEHVVLATARDAHDRDYAVTILTDATASSTPALHEAGLSVTSSFSRHITTVEYAQATAGRAAAGR